MATQLPWLGIFPTSQPSIPDSDSAHTLHQNRAKEGSLARSYLLSRQRIGTAAGQVLINAQIVHVK
jgi:hypothetical protein